MYHTNDSSQLTILVNHNEQELRRPKIALKITPHCNTMAKKDGLILPTYDRCKKHTPDCT